LLRSQLVSRFPVSLLRLSCNTAPSTSRSVLSTVSFVLSRRNSHVIATSAPLLREHFGASLVWIRGGGGGGKDWEEAEEVKGARTKHTENSNSESSEKGGQEPIRPMEPPQPDKKKLFVMAAFLSFAITSLVFSSIIAQNTQDDSAIPSGAPQVDFGSFAKKYLRAGEVQKITFVVGKDKAVATLYPGAIIDGKPAECQHVVINYGHPAQQFWADVRKEEAEMGISLAQGVDLQLFNPVSGLRMFMFFVGCFILGWLFTQYARLSIKKFAEIQRAKKGGAK
ncbi:hypothetical protein PMAYCL1PPCAC_07750, partial [Pristionchus mayeri]